MSMNDAEARLVAQMEDRLQAAEKNVAELLERLARIATNGGCWTYVDERQRLCDPVLAGQDFFNATERIRERLAALEARRDGGGRADG